MINKIRRGAAALLLSTAIISGSAYAETLYVLGNPKGRDVTIKLDPSMAGKTIGVYAPAQSPNHQTVDVEVTGSGGEKISVETYVAAGKESPANAVLKGTVPALMYSAGVGYKQMTILKPGEKSSSSSQSSSSSSNSHAGEDPNCGCLTQDKISTYFAMYQQVNPGKTLADFCGMMPKFGSCDNPFPTNNSSSSSIGADLGPQSIAASSYLSFNKCLPAAKHGVLVNIDLTNVDPAKLDGGQLVVSTLINDFDGDKRATIKPKSDGRYSPQPLLLAGPTGGYYFTKTINAVSMVNWKGKARTKVRPQKVVAFLYYGGGPLLEAPLGRNMSGGKGTFEIVTQAVGYSFCARFERVRQNFNGYKKLG